MPSPDDKYIPVGCLVLAQHETPIPWDVWSHPDLRQWKHVSSGDEEDVDGRSPDVLTAELRHSLMNAPSLAPLALLLSHRWIHLTFRVSQYDATRGIVRVYVLPEDVDRGIIPRSDPSRRKSRMKLFSILDLSPGTWRGEAGSQSESPTGNGSDKDGEDQSLLQLFNNIPSPSPRPDLVEDNDAQQCMYDLLDSNIPGLITELYPYQRRAAAQMLEKETQPGKVLDPRLVPRLDQSGRPWYYDAADGTSFREPRHYDGVQGGILAEQMGSGKTLICLALILATKHQPSQVPDLYRNPKPVRSTIGSLGDMAAACITRHALPWKLALDSGEVEYTRCIEAIQRNQSSYDVPPPPPRRITRRPPVLPPPTKVYSSYASLVVVPPNLVQQWKDEISKHTRGLNVLVMNQHKKAVPPVEELLQYDILIFSYTRFERLLHEGTADRNGNFLLNSPLEHVHIKRCIVDEGHKLGNSTSGSKSNLHLVLECLQLTSRWIVTGTPSKGLYGVDDSSSTPSTPMSGQSLTSQKRAEPSHGDLERDDLKRIGAIATLFLKVRPWANAPDEPGDTPADWSVYVMQPKHSRRSSGRKDCLKATLESLIIRHRLSEIGDLLPVVDEKVVYLDGSYQDVLCLNIFSMIIIFNAIQSQRTDQDYFFHPRQRKFLMQLVSNLRQASFFGGSFFPLADIQTALDTAIEFMEEGKVEIDDDERQLLLEAIELGRLAMENGLKTCASLFHEIPIYIQNFPGGLGRSWSLDESEQDPVCTASFMVLELQKFLQSSLDAPTSLQLLFGSGRLDARGREEKAKALETQAHTVRPAKAVLAGKTQPGQDNTHPSPTKLRSSFSLLTAEQAETDAVEIAKPLAMTQLVSTASAKLSYLIDQIIEHQDQEQIIIFYETENVAYYLAGILEIVSLISVAPKYSH